MLEITETYRVRQLLDRARTRLALLDEAATRIGTTLDVDQTCRELARLLVPRLADIAAVDVLDVAGAPGALPARGSLRLRRVALVTTPKLGKAARYFGAAGTIMVPQASSAVARCLTEQRPMSVAIRLFLLNVSRAGSPSWQNPLCHFSESRPRISHPSGPTRADGFIHLRGVPCVRCI